RAAPLAAGGGTQGIQPGQGAGRSAPRRHRGLEGDASFRRGAAQGGPPAHGRRLLVLRRRAQPRRAGEIPAQPSFAAPVLTHLRPRGALPPGDAGNAQGLTQPPVGGVVHFSGGGIWMSLSTCSLESGAASDLKVTASSMIPSSPEILSGSSISLGKNSSRTRFARACETPANSA